MLSMDTDDWQPVVDVPGPLNSAELAVLYRDASVMLVNPVRDGLNLTAKEFVACQSYNPGTLALSPNAGVFDELGAWSVKVNPKAPLEMSASIYHALMMSDGRTHSLRAPDDYQIAGQSA